MLCFLFVGRREVNRTERPIHQVAMQMRGSSNDAVKDDRTPTPFVLSAEQKNPCAVHEKDVDRSEEKSNEKSRKRSPAGFVRAVFPFSS